MIPSVWLRDPNDQPTNMVLSLTPLSLADITRDAAAGPALVEYLELRGIKTPATLALLSMDEEGLDRTLIQPLLQGWQREDGTTISISETDKPIAKGHYHPYVDDGQTELGTGPVGGQTQTTSKCCRAYGVHRGSTGG